MSDDRADLPTRVVKAIVVGAIYTLLTIVFPALLLRRILESYSFPLSYVEIYGFGALITALQVLATLTEETGPAALFNAGTYIIEIFYIYVGTGGGYISVTSGTTVQLLFPDLVLLMLLYPLFGIARLGITYLLEHSEGSRPIRDEVRG